MTTTPITEPSAADEALPIATWARRASLQWLWWLPILLGSFYGLAILTSLPAILHNTWLSSDSDIDAVLAHLSIHAPAGTLLTTGDFPHYETVAFALLTRSLPFYRTLWIAAPVVFALIGSAAVLWSTARAFGRWPAAVAGAVLVCFGGGGVATFAAGGLATIFAIDAHANTLISAAVVGAGLVWIVPQIAQLSTARLTVAVVALGVVGGLPLAGDSLYLAWGIAPLVVVITLVAWRGPQDGAGRVVAFGVGTLLVTLLTSALFAAVMRSVGVRGYMPAHRVFLTFATPEQIITNFQTLLRALPSLTAGSFFGKTVTNRSELEVMSAALLFAAVVTVIWSVRRRIANAMPRGAGGGDVVGAHFVHIAFWAAALGAGLAMFMIGSPNPWTTDGRYLLGPYVAIAALLPLLLERGLGWKLIVTAAASLFAFSALVQFRSAVHEMAKGYQSARVANRVAAFAKREHVAVGYADYWYSLDLMWESNFGVRVYPVQLCKQNRHRLCSFDEIAMSGWDKPHGNVRSMLVINPKGRGLHYRERAFGQPIASQRVGHLRLYVYPYDIATRLWRSTGVDTVGRPLRTS